MNDRTPHAEIAWLYDLQHFGVKLGLENIRALLGVLGHPERSYPSALVAGTNGKGSVAAMVHSMLGAAGVPAGLFTSPHLMRPNERIRIGEHDVEGDELGRLLRLARERIEEGIARGAIETHPSFFEVITACALQAFRDHGSQAAVLEVGLGGRLDATNAVDAAVAVIVSVDFDHTKTLGPTLERIAHEKAGIIKPGRPLVSGAVRQQAVRVLQDTCQQRGATYIDAAEAVRFVAEDAGKITLETRRRRYPRLALGLRGRHQIHNARVALATFELMAEHLGIEPDADVVRTGLANVRWPGRLEWIAGAGGPDLLLDGAHNPAGAQTLAGYLAEVPRPAPIAVLGVMHGKLLDDMIAPLAPHLHHVVITRPSVRRAAEPDEVAAVVGKYVKSIEIVADPAAAYDRAVTLASPERYVLITGSLYLIGEILNHREPHATPGPLSL